jgi:hypothetical protein
VHLRLHLNEKAARNCAQSSFALLACAQNHAMMEAALSAFTPRFSTFRLQFIDRSFDYRLVRKKGFNNMTDLVSESRKELPKPAEFFLIPGCLYAHIYISANILHKKARKK